MLTLLLRNLPVKHLRRMEFPGGRHRGSHKENIAARLKLACTCMSHSITAITEGRIHSQIHLDILQENHKHIKWSSTEDGRCSRTLTRRRKATTEMLQQKKIRLLEWPRVPNSILWPGVRSTKHSGPPEKMNEPKQFCKEERSKIPPDREAGLIWLRSALPKQSQPLHEIQNFNIFSTLYLKIYRLCFIKMWNHIIFGVLSLTKLCLFKVS